MSANYNYKAYISYNHRDSRWASWLHRTLESYRVPRKLVGTQTSTGHVPKRIKPVFLDRHDLSSSTDLSSTVKSALADSENLLVICSPAAVASNWVNEEILEFARLGRQKQIFCIIVDGEPTAETAGSACFPSALKAIGMHEPLAADVRQWADGKHLSRLKLIAGMLGLSLDQLRRRDLQKRQKIWASAMAASIFVAAILVLAITARMAAQQRRDSGESLVAYKLNELRTMLNVAQDPEGLPRLQQWDEQALASLIGDLEFKHDALVKAALQMRQQGIEKWQTGDLSPALEHFQQSWALLAQCYQLDRSDHSVFFELGQAEYWIGQTYMDLGELAEAENSFMSYAEITRRLILLQPKNAEWVLEMAYALTNLGNLQKSLDSNNPERALQFMQSSLEYNQIALVLDPTNDYYRSELGQSHANLADAQLNVCDLEGALLSRTEQVRLDRNLLQNEPDNVARMRHMAFALTGYATVKEYLGDDVKAIASLEESLRLFDALLAQNVDLHDTNTLALQRKHHLLWLIAKQGDTEAAWATSTTIAATWARHQGLKEQDLRANLSYASFLLDRAWLAHRMDEAGIADQLLDDVQQRLIPILGNKSLTRDAGNMLVQAAFRYWEMVGELPPNAVLSLLPEYIINSGRGRACVDASRAVIKALMLGQESVAHEFEQYLLQNGYREAHSMQVCKTYFLCEGQ